MGDALSDHAAAETESAQIPSGCGAVAPGQDRPAQCILGSTSTSSETVRPLVSDRGTAGSSAVSSAARSSVAAHGNWQDAVADVPIALDSFTVAETTVDAATWLAMGCVYRNTPPEAAACALPNQPPNSCGTSTPRSAVPWLPDAVWSSKLA